MVVPFLLERVMALTKAQIKEFKEADKEAEDCSELSSLAESLFELGDKEWAKKVYKKAEDKAEDSSNFLYLAGSIHEKLDDKEWVTKLYKQAEKKAESYYDYIRITRSIADGENTLQRSNGFLMIIKFKTWCLIFQQL